MRLVRYCVMVACLVTSGRALATVCDCRPQFETSAEASGVCSRTQDDTKWCKLKFGYGATQAGGEKNGPFTEALQNHKISVADVTKALPEVSRPPDQWTLTTVQQYVPAMFAVALWDTAPARLNDVLKTIQSQAERILTAARGDPATFRAGEYQVEAAQGCIQLIDGNFSTMLRTRYAKPPDGRRCGQ